MHIFRFFQASVFTRSNEDEIFVLMVYFLQFPDNFQTFIKVILPLSVPGIVSGVSMVFLPAMTNYVVLDMLYNSTYIMGSLIGSYFSEYDWHNGSMIALILLVIICIVTLVSGDKESENAGRGGLV